MEALLAQIERADDITICRIIQAVIRRYGRVYPDHEMVFLSPPRCDPEERQMVLRDALTMLGLTEV